MKRVILIASFALSWAALLGGCGQGGPKLTSADMKAFEGAAPELKQSWDLAQAAAGTNDYVSAILRLRSMLSPNLSTEQLQAVQNAISSYDEKLLKAADRGDAAAKKTLETLHSPGVQLER